MRMLFVFVLFIARNGFSQELPNKQFNRLAEACKLWGHIKYFHPYLQYKNIPWDSAFIAIVPEIMEATSKNQYRAALSKWLSVLNDPVTNVADWRPISGMVSATNPSPVVELKDSILTVTIHNLKDLEDYHGAGERIKNIGSLVKQAKYVLFDLRADRNTVTDEGIFESGFYPLSPFDAIISETTLKPSLRTVAHDGFVPEVGSTSGGYSTFFRVNRGEVIRATNNRTVPVAFLINRHVALPTLAYTLQQTGKAVIVSEGELNASLPGTTITFQLPDSLLIRMRVGELVTSNGLVNFTADVQLREEPDSRTNIQKTVDYLRNGLMPKIETQSFPQNELPKSTMSTTPYPNLGERVLGAAKMYTVINYFFPNKKLMDQSWDSSFIQHLPLFVAARDSMDYNLAVAKMYAHIQDGHGFINSRVQWAKKFIGNTPAAFTGKVIQNKIVVTALLNDSAARKEGITVGDILLSINGEDAMKKMDKMRSFMPASNRGAQDRELARFLFFFGNDGEVSRLKIQDGSGKIKEISATTRREFRIGLGDKDRPLNRGPIFRTLPGNIGYADLHRLPVPMVDSMFETLRYTKAIIFDMRGYPQGSAWEIGPRLTEKNYVEAALFTRVMATKPLVVSQLEEVKPNMVYSFLQKLPATDKWRYKGKTVMLINEETQSQAEHTGLFFKAANGTRFVGSQTAGANGDVTSFVIPGGIVLWFSGQNVSYPNGQTMQRVGLKPDIEVRPTIEGIRYRKDEVLNKVVQLLQKEKL